MAREPTEEEIQAAVEEVMRNDDELRREVEQAVNRKKEGFLTRLVKGIAEAIFGSTFVELARRVVQALLGMPPY